MRHYLAIVLARTKVVQRVPSKGSVKKYYFTIGVVPSKGAVVMVYVFTVVLLWYMYLQ